MENCLFCKIVRGEIPCLKVYEDEDVMAFLDINPISKGHTLVIPKTHHVNVLDIPSDLLAKVNIVAQKIAKNNLEKLEADGINFLQSNKPAANQVIMHYHLHVIPRYANDGIRLLHGTMAEKQDLEDIAKQISI